MRVIKLQKILVQDILIRNKLLQIIEKMNYLILLISALIITSCTQSAPYEVKSPCVAIDANIDESMPLPCIRRPANLNHDIV